MVKKKKHCRRISGLNYLRRNDQKTTLRIDMCKQQETQEYTFRCSYMENCHRGLWPLSKELM